MEHDVHQGHDAVAQAEGFRVLLALGRGEAFQDATGVAAEHRGHAVDALQIEVFQLEEDGVDGAHGVRVLARVETALRLRPLEGRDVAIGLVDHLASRYEPELPTGYAA